MHARFFFWEMCVLVFMPNTRARSAPPSQIPGLCTCAGPEYKKNMGVRPTKRTQTKSLQRCTPALSDSLIIPPSSALCWHHLGIMGPSPPLLSLCSCVFSNSILTCELDLNRARDLLLLCMACLLPTWSCTLHTVRMCTSDLQFKLV